MAARRRSRSSRKPAHRRSSRGSSRRSGNTRVIRYSDADVVSLLVGTHRPAWDREAHLIAAAKQRGYRGDDNNLERKIRFLEENGDLYARSPPIVTSRFTRK